MTDLRRVRPRIERAVSASADDPAELVVQFLTRLLQLHDEEGFLLRDLEVRSLGRPPRSLVASLSGEPFDPARHPSRTEVKAITLHRLEFDPAAGRARVIVDI